jgi:hypothetical protein
LGALATDEGERHHKRCGQDAERVQPSEEPTVMAVKP